ncbi:MAG: PaaI family thioesterase [Syntrophomonadales bacterium]|jgi:acyl-CoA thioesterase
MSEIENRGLEEDLFNALIDHNLKGLFYNMLGLRPTGLGRGWARHRLVLSEQHCNAQGKPHGGVIATMADTAMGTAIATTGNRPVTAELTLHLINSPQVGAEVVVEAEVVSIGSRVIFTKATVTSKDRIIATAQGCFVNAGPVKP